MELEDDHAQGDAQENIQAKRTARGEKGDIDEKQCYTRSNEKIENPDIKNENTGEFWRPSFMFHELKHIGGDISEAYNRFKHYRGRQSYLEIKLDHPKPMQDGEDDDGSEWSHMSDYDDMGAMPISVEQAGGAEADTTGSNDYERAAETMHEWQSAIGDSQQNKHHEE